MTPELFRKYAALVIDTVEGGYYHPDMMKDGRVKPDPRYNESGETIFGIDRKNAPQDVLNNPAGIKLWEKIDNAGAAKKWAWNYKGGAEYNTLRDLAAQSIYPAFLRMFEKYLTPGSRKVVERDAALMFHFVYAVWNGEGWFQTFARGFNKKVDSGASISDLREYVEKQRTGSKNSLIKQGGAKIATLFKTIDKKIDTVKAAGTAHPAALFFLGLVVVLTIIYFYNNKQTQTI